MHPGANRKLESFYEKEAGQRQEKLPDNNDRFFWFSIIPHICTRPSRGLGTAFDQAEIRQLNSHSN